MSSYEWWNRLRGSFFSIKKEDLSHLFEDFDASKISEHWDTILEEDPWIVRNFLLTFIHPLKPFLSEVPLTEEQHKKVWKVLPFIPEKAAIAGGFVRDLLRGEECRDVDVFGDSQSLSQFFNKDQCEINSNEYGDIEWIMKFPDIFEGKEVQYICVRNVLAHIRLFDAPCNMLFLTSGGKIFAAHEHAVEHALSKKYEPSLIQNTRRDRVDKFLINKGWSGVSVETLLDKLGL